MKKFYIKNSFVSVTLSVLFTFVFVFVVVQAATTISTNINTGGTLTVTGNHTLIGTTTQSGLSVMTLEATSTAAIPLTLRGYASQVANLFQLHNVGGTELFALDSAGNASTTMISTTGNLWVNGYATTTGSNGNFAMEGNLTVGGTTELGGSASTTGSAALKSANITSDTGAISFGNENLTTTGTLTIGGNLTLQNSETISNSTDGTVSITAGTTTVSGIFSPQSTSAAIECLSTNKGSIYWDSDGTGCLAFCDGISWICLATTSISVAN